MGYFLGVTKAIIWKHLQSRYLYCTLLNNVGNYCEKWWMCWCQTANWRHFLCGYHYYDTTAVVQFRWRESPKTWIGLAAVGRGLLCRQIVPLSSMRNETPGCVMWGGVRSVPQWAWSDKLSFSILAPALRFNMSLLGEKCVWSEEGILSSRYFHPDAGYLFAGVSLSEHGICALRSSRDKRRD